MKTAAIIYCSRHGQTEKIADYMRGRMTQAGLGVEIYSDAALPESLSPATDFVIVGAPVYAGRFPPKLLDWVRRHQAELRNKPSAFFSVSLNVADHRPQCRVADDWLIRKFVSATGWQPAYVASLAGALKYSKYNWFLRRMMRRISRKAGGPVDMAKDYELTDWSAVDSFVDSFLAERSPSAYQTQVRLNL